MTTETKQAEISNEEIETILRLDIRDKACSIESRALAVRTLCEFMQTTTDNRGGLTALAQSAA
ncbi:MAG: hypothetical protein WCI11_16655 [Candidatus Methylumidiphilus sp.]